MTKGGQGGLPRGSDIVVMGMVLFETYFEGMIYRTLCLSGYNI